MEWMISLAQLLLSLSFLVAVHEFGHLLAAKYFGMRVEQFSIGFPPKIWSFKKGETEYALSAIPLGGYVKISGMIDESLDTETMKQEPQPWEFRSKPAWQRLIVMLGGIFVNVVIGILIFIGITFAFGDQYILKDVVNENGGFNVGPIGQKVGLKTGDKIVKINGQDFEYIDQLTAPEFLLTKNASYTIVRDGQPNEIQLPGDIIQSISKDPYQFVDIRNPAIVGEVTKKSFAEKVGLQKGDVVKAVNGVPVVYVDEIAPLIKSRKDSLQLTIQRAGQSMTFKDALKDSTIGFRSLVNQTIKEKGVRTIKYGFVESIPLGTERAFTTLIVQIKALGKIVRGELKARESLSGPIGIMHAFGVSWDWERFWKLTGVLSLVLAFMNLLPIPALDGGHVMFLSYEIISRRKPSDKFLETAQKVGMVFLLLLMVFIFANDIMKLVGKG